MKKLLIANYFMLVLLASCGSDKKTEEKENETPAKADTLSAPVGEGEEVKNIMLAIENYMEKQVSDRDFYGAVKVYKDDAPLYENAFGKADIEKGTGNLIETKFNLASVTKQFTSMLILQMVQEGKIKLQSKLSEYLPYYRKDVADQVTIHQLLSHTSGIPSYTNEEGFMETNLCDSVGTKDFVLSNCSEDLEFEPGTQWNYNNSGYYILGAIVEEVAGKPYHEVLEEKIFGPLGMKNSGVDYGGVTNKAKGYSIGDAGEPVDANCIHMSIPHGGGAIYSTVGDMYLWDRALYTEKLLSKALIDSMFTPVMHEYSYGWGIREEDGRTIISHGGGIFGFSTYILRIPEENLFVCVLSNYDAVNSGLIAKDITAIVLGKEVTTFKDFDEIEMSEEELSEYVGKFELASEVLFEFKVNDGRFFGVVTGQNPVQLFPYEKDKFFLKVVDAQVEFVRNDEGKVASMVLHQNGSHPAKKLE